MTIIQITIIKIQIIIDYLDNAGAMQGYKYKMSFKYLLHLYIFDKLE